MSRCVGIIKFKTSDFIIKTCACYLSNWEKIRKLNDEEWEFDRIESGKKSFRKLFHRKMTILHCCYSCFEKVIMLNQIVMNSNEPYGNCLKKMRLNLVDCSQICNGCVEFFIILFENELFTL